MADCKLCGLPISFRLLKDGRWLRLNPDGRDHRETCPGLKRQTRNEVRDSNHEEQAREFLTAKPSVAAPRPEADFRITAKWLLTAIKWGAITAAQAKVLNLSYPPLKGWKTKLIGTVISAQQKEAVESPGTRRGKQAKHHRHKASANTRTTGTQPSQKPLFEDPSPTRPTSGQKPPDIAEDEGLPW